MKNFKKTFTTYRKYLLLLVFAVLFTAGCRENSEDNQQTTQQRTVSVRAAAVSGHNFEETIRSIGTLQAKNTIQISSELSGILTEVHFKEGAAVKAGDLLFSINDSKLQRELAATQAALDKASTQLDYAEKTYERFQALLADGAATQDGLDRASTEFFSAQSEVDRLDAQVELIKERISDARITAPIDGVLGARLIDAGNYINIGSPLVTLYSVAEMEIVFSIPERYMGKVTHGQLVDVSVQAFPESDFQGRINYISPSIDQSTRNFQVKAVIDNEDNLLKSGAFASSHVTISVRENRPTVPESALIATTDGYIVYVIEDGTAITRPVQVGMRNAGLAEINDGLELNEIIVTAGQMRLSNNAQVTIIEDRPEPVAADFTSSIKEVK